MSSSRHESIGRQHVRLRVVDHLQTARLPIFRAHPSAQVSQCSIPALPLVPLPDRASQLVLCPLLHRRFPVRLCGQERQWSCLAGGKAHWRCHASSWERRAVENGCTLKKSPCTWLLLEKLPPKTWTLQAVAGFLTSFLQLLAGFFAVFSVHFLGTPIPNDEGGARCAEKGGSFLGGHSWVRQVTQRGTGVQLWIRSQRPSFLPPMFTNFLRVL